jgi:hypothetical protein
MSNRAYASTIVNDEFSVSSLDIHIEITSPEIICLSSFSQFCSHFNSAINLVLFLAFKIQIGKTF